MGEEDDGVNRPALSCVTDGDVGSKRSIGRNTNSQKFLLGGRRSWLIPGKTEYNC